MIWNSETPMTLNNSVLANSGGTVVICIALESLMYRGQDENNL